MFSWIRFSARSGCRISYPNFISSVQRSLLAEKRFFSLTIAPCRMSISHFQGTLDLDLHLRRLICRCQPVTIRDSGYRSITVPHTDNRSRVMMSNFIHSARISSKSKRPFEINKNLSHDVLVFSHKNDHFYKFLSYFGLFQLFIWGYMAFFAVQYLKRAPSSVRLRDTGDLSWWKRFLYKEGQYKNALSIICLFVGATVLFITMAYPRRVVRDLWILKGGNDVKISTYSWLGRSHSFQKPVEHLNCMESRTGSGHHIPIKIKGKYFYYLLDKQGSFPNTDLFDFVIGVKRSFK